MKFDKISAVDFCGLSGPARSDVLSLSTREPFLADDDPPTAEEVVKRVGDADCVLVSWRTKITADILRACPTVKYVGMCCSLYDEKAANVDIAEARKRGISVRGVKDYGDDGTLEFIFSELIGIYKGLGPRRWSEESTELTSKTIGIVGMGVVGKMVARAALLFGMKVLYTARSGKPEMDELGCVFMDLASLLPQCDVVTAHLPRNTLLFGAKEFQAMKEKAIFVNTSLGQPFDKDAFFAWIGRNSGNFAVFDLPGSGLVTEQCKQYPNISLYPKPSGFTVEARYRLTAKVHRNMVDFLNGK